MSLITINDVDVIAGTITMPLIGVWTADLVIDQPDGTGFDEGTEVTIASADGFELDGVVAPNRTGDFLDTVHVRVLGGKSGMAKQAKPRFYSQPGAYVRDVVNGLVGDAGESLSNTADQSLLNSNLVAWSVVAVPVSQALSTLLATVSPGASWRILADGTLWIGSESWDTASGTFDILDQSPADGTFELGVESPFITPGVTLDGVGKVNRVEHQIHSKQIRSRVWADMAQTDRGLKAAVTSLVKQAVASIDYLALYNAKVVSQSSDNTTVDVQPDDSRLPGLSKVPLRHGVPGMTAQVQPGAYVQVGWDGGNPSKPFACLWKGGETVVKLNLTANEIVLNNGTNHVIRVGDSTQGHQHSVTGNAGPYPIASGLAVQATDSMAENGGTVKAG